MTVPGDPLGNDARPLGATRANRGAGLDVRGARLAGMMAPRLPICPWTGAEASAPQPLSEPWDGPETSAKPAQRRGAGANLQ